MLPQVCHLGKVETIVGKVAAVYGNQSVLISVLFYQDRKLLGKLLGI